MDKEQDNLNETPKRKPTGKRQLVLIEPGTKRNIKLPQEKLSTKATTREIVQRVNKLEDVVLVQNAVISEFREYFNDKRMQKDVDLNAVRNLAARGVGTKTISTLLGFDYHMFGRRKEVQEAFDVGRAELKHALLTKQIDAALSGNVTMMIFMGKQILDQASEPNTVLNIGIQNVGSDLRTKIKAQREKALQTFTDVADEIVDAAVEAKDGDAE